MFLKKVLISSKSTRRSLVFKRKMSNQPFILSLPHEIIRKILLKTCDDSHKNLQRTKRACHMFRDVMEEDWFNREMDLWEMFVRVNWSDHAFEDLKQLCLQLQNSSAMYLRGIKFLVYEQNLEDGLNLIGKASEKGYDLAMYANACLQRVIQPTTQFNSEISREFVKKVREKLSKDTSGLWYEPEGHLLVKMRAAIDFSSIEKCKCISNSGWHQPFKGPGECDECYWKAESWSFLHKCITGTLVRS